MDITLQTALAEMVTQLATFFGTTTEAIMENAPSFLRSYGWYNMVEDIPPMFLLSLLVSALLVLLVFGVMMTLEVDTLNKKVVITTGIIAFVVPFVIIVGTKIALCMVSPEIAGVQALLANLK